VLITSIVVVQIGTAFIESVGNQVTKGMPRAPDLVYKESKKSFTDKGGDFTGPAKESMGCTSSLTDVRKRHMSNSTPSTSDSQETPLDTHPL
jgi:hypothetical protein